MSPKGGNFDGRNMSVKRLLVIAAVVSIVATACGSSKSSSSSATTAAGGSGAQTYNVQVDHKGSNFNVATTAYFPDAITAHPGDTVHFTSVFTGEPHTVTFGTLVTQGLTAYEAAAKSNPNVDDHTIPQLAKIPDMLPQGPGDANQATAQPCFLDSGDPPGPGATACPQKAQPDFTGTESLFNSGWLPDGATFDVKLASSIAPGTYRFMCALHRSGMTGTLTVVAAGQPASTASDLKSKADSEFQTIESALSPLVQQANAVTAPDKAAAGLASQSAQNAFAAVMTPKTISVPVGGSVTWTIFGPHTISFGTTQDYTPALSKAPDGAVHLNPKAFAPSGTPGAPPGPPPTAPGPPKVIDGGTYNGTGVFSTGIVLSFPPVLIAYKIKFSKAGTYSYKCLIHPDMEGTVKVG
jgi:plastocyanin